MFVVPVLQNIIGCLRKRGIILGKGGVNHWQFMRICADRLDLAVHGDLAVRRPDKGLAQPFLHRLNAPVLPQERMAAARAEVGDRQIRYLAQFFDLFPDTGHAAGVKDLQFEFAHPVQHRATAQFHQNRKGRNFPKHHLGPCALKCQLVLVAFALQMIGRQPQPFEPFHEIRAEHLALAVKRVAAQPSAFSPAEGKRTDVIKLLAQFAFVDQIGKGNML